MFKEALRNYFSPLKSGVFWLMIIMSVAFYTQSVTLVVIGMILGFGIILNDELKEK